MIQSSLFQSHLMLQHKYPAWLNDQVFSLYFIFNLREDRRKAPSTLLRNEKGTKRNAEKARNKEKKEENDRTKKQGRRSH